MSETSPGEIRAPKKIAQATRAKGRTKAELDAPVLLMLALLAGAYIAFGGLFAMTALAGTAEVLPFGPAQVLAGVVFSLGLILVLLGGAELFTGNTLLVVAWAEGRAGFAPILWALLLAYVANFAGSIAIVLLAFAAELHLAGDGAVGAAILSAATSKVELGFGEALASGILANMLVCLAVWLAFGARSAADKVLVIIPPIAAFVAMGLEHSVANMSLIPLGWLIQGGEGAIDAGSLIGNLVPVTIGNVIGGGTIGLAYWFAYLRPRQPGEEASGG
ncbi:MAG TPA: formate/nitrite transporter family protein [Mesorhizobium sp.]|jgi:formate/nitrite transporter|nr:formate/nitrite transporter family protein [Mesorhizobium sp.]